jgi:broad specificity phosphatase PhoE
MTAIILVRHGATEWNETRRAQGLADVEISDQGRRQADEAAERLRDVHLDAVFSSNLSRAIETARPIAESHGLEVRTDPAFNEIDQGEWTGLTTAEIGRRWPDLWGDSRHYSPRPGGESPQDVRSRALHGIRRVVEMFPGGRAVVVSHGGTIRWLSAEALGYSDKESMSIRGLRNGEYVCLEAKIEDGGLTLGGLERPDGSSVERADDPNA